MPAHAVLRSMSVALLIAACGKADPEKKADPETRAQPVAEPRRSIDARPEPPAVEAREPPAFDVRAQLAAATEIVLYAVDPDHRNAANAEKEFHGFPIRKTVALPAADVAAVAAAVREGIGQVSMGDVPACFDPHHALQITTPTGTTDLVICFQCRQLYAYQGEKEIWDTIPRDGDAVLARYLGETPDLDDPWP
jgi:hypothetical protein